MELRLRCGPYDYLELNDRVLSGCRSGQTEVITDAAVADFAASTVNDRLHIAMLLQHGEIVHWQEDGNIAVIPGAVQVEAGLSMATSADGCLHLVYLVKGPRRCLSLFHQRFASGRGWGKPVLVGRNASVQPHSSHLAVGPGGAVHLLFCSAQTEYIQYRVLGTDGAWSGAMRLSATRSHSPFSLLVDGKLHCLWLRQQSDNVVVVHRVQERRFLEETCLSDETAVATAIGAVVDGTTLRLFWCQQGKLRVRQWDGSWSKEEGCSGEGLVRFRFLIGGEGQLCSTIPSYGKVIDHQTADQPLSGAEELQQRYVALQEEWRLWRNEYDLASSHDIQRQLKRLRQEVEQIKKQLKWGRPP